MYIMLYIYKHTVYIYIHKMYISTHSNKEVNLYRNEKLEHKLISQRVFSGINFNKFNSGCRWLNVTNVKCLVICWGEIHLGGSLTIMSKEGQAQLQYMRNCRSRFTKC